QLNRAETEAGGTRAISLAQSRIEESAKLAQGERQLRLERVEENRAIAIARTQAEGIAAAEEDAAKRRVSIALQQADLENQIRTRRAYLAEAPFLTAPQRAKEEQEIAERRAKQFALQEQLGNVDLELDQK